jgi:hypothetical protein
MISVSVEAFNAKTAPAKTRGPVKSSMRIFSQATNAKRKKRAAKI